MSNVNYSQVPRALVFDPYFAALGGGERYAMEFAEALGEWFTVDLGVPRVPTSSKLQERGLSTDMAFRRVTSRRFSGISREYDLTAQIANYVPPTSKARRSVILLQFPHGPFNWRHPARHVFRHRRLGSAVIVTYSAFSAGWCQRRWGFPAIVLYPPVALGTGPREKRKRILAVGRFFLGAHTKRQDALIEAFRRLPADVRASWRLVLLGGSGHSTSGRYLDMLARMADGLNVSIVVDASPERLSDEYQKASLFWHATGYGRRGSDPEAAEHFGISTVEAMSYGCVPLVYDDGGQREIVASTRYGYRWRSVDELVGLSVQLVSSPARTRRMSECAVARSSAFGVARFRDEVGRILIEKDLRP